MLKQKQKSRAEPTIALINIVFLMLIFFMIAGTLAAPLDRDLSLIETEELEGREPPDTLVIHSDGRLMLQGEQLGSAAAFMATLSEEQRGGKVRVVPDKTLPAADLVRVATELRAAGAAEVLVVTERALQ